MANECVYVCVCVCVYVCLCSVDKERASTATTGTDGHSRADLINTVGSSKEEGEIDCSQRKRDDGPCFGYG